ncbi:MAG TPA: hypothetical protein VHB02_06830 [Acidimicrobiales bacterium]|nr:hypothetical protein [Acidimicrobiales bacterium]
MIDGFIGHPPTVEADREVIVTDSTGSPRITGQVTALMSERSRNTR